MGVVAVVGAQWGDEGKGKVVDHLADGAALTVHYAGGYSAGESLVVDGERLVFRTIPCRSLRQGKTVLLARGMALDPRLLLEEFERFQATGALRGELWIDQRAHVVLPHHIELDQRRGEVEGASGVPRRGLGPAYGDRVLRRGIRIGDIIDARNLETAIRASIEASRPSLTALGAEVPDASAVADTYAACGERLRAHVIDGARRIVRLADAGEEVILEGPLGTMVDVDHGYYPYVVSAETVAGGACVGTGISPRRLDRVIGVAKAYATRPGPGPLSAEVTGDLASALQQRGGEVSPSTGRPRRCGMFDISLLRYAARVNGMDAVALTKLDVLTGLGDLPICVGHTLDGELQEEPPFEGEARMQPLVEILPGWTESLSDCRRWEELPPNAQRYVSMIEENARLPIEWVSVGPDPAQMIHRSHQST